MVRLSQNKFPIERKEIKHGQMVAILAIAVNCNFLSFEVYLGLCQKQNDGTFLRKAVHYFHKKFHQKIHQ